MRLKLILLGGKVVNSFIESYKKRWEFWMEWMGNFEIGWGVVNSFIIFVSHYFVCTQFESILILVFKEVSIISVLFIIMQLNHEYTERNN